MTREQRHAPRLSNRARRTLLETARDSAARRASALAMTAADLADHGQPCANMSLYGADAPATFSGPLAGAFMRAAAIRAQAALAANAALLGVL